MDTARTTLARHRPCQHLNLGLPASTIVRSELLLFKSHSLWHFVMVAAADEDSATQGANEDIGGRQCPAPLVLLDQWLRASRVEQKAPQIKAGAGAARHLCRTVPYRRAGTKWGREEAAGPPTSRPTSHPQSDPHEQFSRAQVPSSPRVTQEATGDTCGSEHGRKPCRSSVRKKRAFPREHVQP